MKNSKFRIRPPKTSDVADLAVLYGEFTDPGQTGEYTPTAEDFKKEAEHALEDMESGISRVFMAVDASNKPVGFAHVTSNGLNGDAFLTSLYTRPECRGKGVGSALMAECERWVKQRGTSEIHLLVNATKTRTREMYEHRGYNDKNPGYQRIETPGSITMRKPLNL
ncbi:MAG: GNAT family N-acetyltransferase [Alphaproteobacteria bacterium]